jgi:hypothetical protein
MSLTPPRSLGTIDAEELKAKKEAPSIAEQQSALPYHIAYVIDGVVQTVFHVEERMAAILMSNPLVVQCNAPLDNGPDSGWTYNDSTGEFSKPA